MRPWTDEELKRVAEFVKLLMDIDRSNKRFKVEVTKLVWVLKLYAAKRVA